MSNLKELEKEIKDRQKIINQIVKFVEKIVVAHGELIERREGSCNINVIWELKNFDGFSFRADLGHTMFGGNDIYILYCDELVFKVYYQADVEECKVDTWVEEEQWLTALQKLMRNPEKTLKQLGLEKKKLEDEYREKAERLQEHERLQKNAKRLGLV